jgi:hypothetical protein
MHCNARSLTIGLLYYCNDRNEAFISISRIQPKFDEQFSNQIRQNTKGFKNAAGTLSSAIPTIGICGIIAQEQTSYKFIMKIIIKTWGTSRT